jgi:hypothetical protein
MITAITSRLVCYLCGSEKKEKTFYIRYLFSIGAQKQSVRYDVNGGQSRDNTRENLRRRRGRVNTGSECRRKVVVIVVKELSFMRQYSRRSNPYFHGPVRRGDCTTLEHQVHSSVQDDQFAAPERSHGQSI